MPNAANQLDLGYHASCYGAVQKAKDTYWQSNGCYYCCPDCNTG
jgi:hypothetical protein